MELLYNWQDLKIITKPPRSQPGWLIELSAGDENALDGVSMLHSMSTLSGVQLASWR